MRDRFVDSRLIAGMGYAVGMPSPGWVAALFAALTAYVRVFGGSIGLEQRSLGPMAKQHRMAVLSAACILTGDGRIRLNWRLIHFPLSIIDYVVAHELAHLREMNHSPRFWQTVESIFPEFREARHTLKHHPPELLPAL